MRGTQLNRITELLDNLHTRKYEGYRPDALPLFHHHVTSNGDDGMTTNVSGVSEPMTLWPPAGKIYVVNITTVYLEDTGQVRAGRYGAVDGGLVNGIDLRLVSASGASEIFRFGSLSHLVKHNGDWAKYSDVLTFSDFATGGNWIRGELVWGTPMALNGDKNEGLQFIMNDDFTGLDEHEFISKGMILDT